MSRSTLLSSGLLLTFTACGGGGDAAGEIAGLQGPQQVSIIESSAAAAAAVALAPGTRAAVGSSYQTDPTHMWVDDDSMRALDTVNMILDSLSQTKYAEQTNAGVDRCLVEAEDDHGGERGNSGPEYEEWTVLSTRASNDSPQLVKFWLDNDEPMGTPMEALIYGSLTIEEEPSEDRPLGRFALYFKCLPEAVAHDSSATIFQGYLRTVPRTDDQSEVEFYMWHGDPDGVVPEGEFHMRERVHVLGNPGDDSGRAYSESKQASNNAPGMGGGIHVSGTAYQLQFNADYVALDDGNELDVKSRTNFATYVHRYGIYDAVTEERVELNSGFSVEDASGNHGWAGYHGLWFPENVTVTDGMTVYRRSHRDNTMTPFTVVAVPGRLEKRTRASITLGDIESEELQMHDGIGGAEIRVAFTGSDFVRVATRINGEWSFEATPVSIASSFATGQWVYCWSEARGSVEFPWPSTLSETTPAFVWSSTTITADSPELANGDLTLHGYFHMLRADITAEQANFLGGASPYLPDATTATSGNQSYVFDKETLMLQLGGHDVNFATGVVVTSGPAQWGINCGPLFASALGELGEAAAQTTTYDWRIGGNSWNQLRTLVDAQGRFVSFDPPLRLNYTHNESGSEYHGRTVYLEWTGTERHGIPHREDRENNRWYPCLNIPTGAVLTSGANSYKVKQIEGQQIMLSVIDPAAVYQAQGFDLGTPLSAPTAAPYQDPNTGPRPVVTAPPRYVGGILQSDG